MTPLEERWADAALRAFLEPNNQGTSPTTLTTAPHEVDYLVCLRRMRAASTTKAAFGLRIAVWLVALAPLWLWGKLATIQGVPLSQRTSLVGELLTHRFFVVRELMLLLKLTASIALLGTPSVRARSRYDSVTRSKPKTRLPLAS